MHIALELVGSIVALRSEHCGQTRPGRTRSWWLRFHIWFGLVSFAIIACHSGLRFRPAVTLTFLLWLLVLGVLASGIFGLIVQHVLPGLMTRKIDAEVPYDQIPAYSQKLAARAKSVLERLLLLPAPMDGEPPAANAGKLWEAFFDDEIRPFLLDRQREFRLSTEAQAREAFAAVREKSGWRVDPEHAIVAENLRRRQSDIARVRAINALLDLSSLEEFEKAYKALFSAKPPLPENDTRDLVRLCRDRWLEELEQMCTIRRRWSEQERLHFWLHSWLHYVHIPLAVALGVLAAVHIVVSLIY